MSRSFSFAAPVLVLSILLLAGGGDDALAPDGVRRASIEASLVLERLVQLAPDGSEQDLDPDGRLVYRLRNRRQVTVHDRWLATGALADRRREYSVVEGSLEAEHDLTALLGSAGLERDQARLASPLAGAVATFPTGGGTPRFESGGGARLDALASGLAASFDVTGLVPETIPAPGEEWRVAPSRLRPLLGPGGDLGLRTDALPAQEARILALAGCLDLELFTRDMRGTALVKRVGSEEPRRVDLQLELRLRGELDLLPALQGCVESREREWLSQVTSARARWSYDAEGSLRWDVGSARASEARLGGQLALVLEGELVPDADPGSGDPDPAPIRWRIELTGSATSLYALEPR